MDWVSGAKNVSLLDSIYMVDGLTAVKHGNVRVGGLVARKWDYFGWIALGK
ncbi:MAG: hypothetical protein IPI23_02030 [Bacteroidetes bacterium]|nr:hypothetical protein [Bacteroidota bacterium]